MANELTHKDPGSELTQAEFIASDGTGHVFDSQATGDILYASSATVLSRLAKATDGNILELASNLPAWTASPTIGSTNWGNANHAHAASNSGGQIATSGLATDAVTGAKIADDALDSEHYTDGSIDTAHIADNQVTLAKMAGITRGSMIIGDASGDPSALAKGTETYILTAGASDISWAAPAASGVGIGLVIALS